jgi:hypothetical protein
MFEYLSKPAKFFEVTGNMLQFARPRQKASAKASAKASSKAIV